VTGTRRRARLNGTGAKCSAGLEGGSHNEHVDAAYYRAYRAANLERLREYDRQRRKNNPRLRAQRKASEQRRRAKLRGRCEPLPELFPDLVRGAVLMFREEAIDADVRQERELAKLEGRDPDEAERRYRSTELAWVRLTLPLPSS
jgi:hypothetical protein